MIDEINYEYVPLGLPNIVLEKPRNGTLPEGVHIHEFIAPLIKRLAKARPSWKFVGRSSVNNSVSRFAIYEGQEDLGWVCKSWRGNHGDSFKYDCRRMNAARQRGCATVTKNPSKAFKDITKSFGAKTITELLIEARGVANTAVNRAVSEATGDYDRNIYLLTGIQSGFVYANWSKFREFVEQVDPSLLTTVDKVPAAREKYDATQDMRTMRDKGNGSFVMLRGNEYVIQRGEAYTIVNNEQLTPHMKRALGMLKLADNGTFIPPYGVRGNATSFFIMDEISTE